MLSDFSDLRKVYFYYMRLIISSLLCLLTTFLMGQETAVVAVTEGPPDAKPGLCYVKRLLPANELEWKAILCEWKEFITLEMLQDDMNPKLSNYDEHYINKRARPLLDRGLSLEIESYYSSPASDTTDLCLAEARAVAIGEYLVEQGLQRSQYKVTVLSVKDSMGSRLRMRVISAIAKTSQL